MLLEPPDGGAGAAASDPLADLLFTLIAAVLPAILLLAPLTRQAGESAARNAALAAPEVTLHGAAVAPIVAGADGLRLGGAGGRLVGLDRIGDDPGLAAQLDRARLDGAPPLLIVEPDGLESAFLLDPVAADHGVPRFDEIRSAVACRGADDAALRALCGSAP